MAFKGYKYNKKKHTNYTKGSRIKRQKRTFIRNIMKVHREIKKDIGNMKQKLVVIRDKTI